MSAADNQTSSPDDQAGFTLIEVLVAMAILAFGLAAILQSVTGALDTSARAADMIDATQRAQSRVAALALDAPLAVGRQSDESGAVEVTAAADGMALVTVTIANRRSIVRLITLRPLAGRR